MMDDIKPMVGGVYHVRRSNAPCLDTVEVIEITERTILIQGDVGEICRQYPSRYTPSSLEFIEEVTEPDTSNGESDGHSNG